jgi:hypothetical protein
MWGAMINFHWPSADYWLGVATGYFWTLMFRLGRNREEKRQREKKRRAIDSQDESGVT